MNEFAPITDGKTIQYSQNDVDTLLNDQRQTIIDEVSVYLMDVHIGLTREDAKLIEYLLSPTGEKG